MKHPKPTPPAIRPGGRALLFSELFPPAIGGSAVLFEGIYSRLLDADVQVLTDAAGAASEDWHGPMRVFRRSLATRWHGVMDPRGLAHHVRVGLQLRRLASGAIVHCGRAVPEGITAMLARLVGGPRYVCWAHGEDIAGALASREFALLTKLVYRFADAAIANSRNTAGLLRSLGVPSEKIEIVYPAVDTDRFRPDVNGCSIRRRYAGPGDVLLLSVGRLQRRKGHDVAIEAMAQLADELPNLRYVIAGDGDERARLEELARARGVNDRVFFAGVVADDDLPAYYAACDVFLLPNRIDNGDLEGFGIVFLEAAATGRPAIGGDSGGVPEAIERDVTGLLVDGADARHVASAIRALAGSEERRRQMGAAGRARARDAFSWPRATAIVSELQVRINTKHDASVRIPLRLERGAGR
jgi:phosphatidylinositol alpha-1,6-mannosyltransferase